MAEKVTGEKTTLEEMGGAVMHASVSGCADEVFDADWQVIAAARLLLSYLPDRWTDRPRAAPPASPAADLARRADPRRSQCRLRRGAVIDRLVDDGSFFEVKARWAQEMVTGFGRLGGRTVGIVANQPSVRAGASSSTRRTRPPGSSRCATRSTSP